MKSKILWFLLIAIVLVSGCISSTDNIKEDKVQPPKEKEVYKEEGGIISNNSNTIMVENVELEWIRHASFKIKSGNIVIYTDPYKISNKSRREKADLILITHDHFDHCDPKSVNAIKKDDTVVITTSNCKNKLGFGKTISEGDTITEKGVEIKAVSAYNIGKPYHPKGVGVGFVFKIGNQTIYQAGDTDKIPEMENLGKIDIALLPIGGKYTMDAKEAAEAVALIKPKIVIPMHYGTLKDTPGNPEKFKELVGDLAKVKILG